MYHLLSNMEIHHVGETGLTTNEITFCFAMCATNNIYL